MDVALFVPCYIDQVLPQVAIATVAILRHVGCRITFEPRQTCCGQPMANSGCAGDARVLARRHLDLFRGRTVVSPSASCVAMVRRHYSDLIELSPDDETDISRTYELSEFLVNVLGVTDLGARFPHRVALHPSCHGLRELGHGSMSEIPGPMVASPAQRLLERVADLDLVRQERAQECCGFGGTFADSHSGISIAMGQDRCAAIAAAGADYVTGTDSSCLMHLDGIACRRGGARAIHLAEILACR